MSWLVAAQSNDVIPCDIQHWYSNFLPSMVLLLNETVDLQALIDPTSLLGNKPGQSFRTKATQSNAT